MLPRAGLLQLERAARGERRRRLLAHTLIVVSLACPGSAFPLSLQQLLRLPLEQLLRLQVTTRDSHADSPRAGRATRHDSSLGSRP
jgi:hypothetical protein